MRCARWLIAGMFLLSAGVAYAGDAKGEADMGDHPSVAPKKVLVVYYSRTGHTKKAAEEIARALNAGIEQLIDKKDRGGAGGYIIAGKDAARENPAEIEPVRNDPSKYDLVVLGTPVWAWNMTPAIRAYVTAHGKTFRNIAIFTFAGGTKSGRIVEKIETLAGKKAVASAGFLDSDLKEGNSARYEGKLKAFTARLLDFEK